MAIHVGNGPSFAYFRFHLNVGTRLALRTLIPLVAISFTIYYLFKPEFFYSIIAVLTDKGFLAIGVLYAVISLSIAGMAALRVCLGLNGWIRHLPADSHTHRRLAGFAIFVAQLPILAILAILTLIASVKFGFSAAAYLAGLPILGLASSVYVLPVRRKIITRPLAAFACVFSASGYWPLVFVSIALIIITDLISGPLCPTKSRSKLKRAFKGSLLTATIGWRALRLRLLIPYLPALTALGVTALFLSNNSPDPLLSMKVIRFGGAFSMIVFCAIFANMLGSRRPSWPWVRSLPWSSKQRIVIDSAFLSLHTIPLLVLVGTMNIKATFPLAASLPLLVVYASGTMRRSSEYRMGAYGRVFLSGIMGSFLLCLIPLISLAFLALTPLALKVAVKEEQSQKVSRWLELHHLAAGDSLSWSK